jgi:2-polyprenyl-3-methyl-5-hydroxy-6-metoxy-1,4-benzoquinol methylase
MSDFFDKSYYEAGPQTGKSLYQNYRWIPELTIPLAHHIVSYTETPESYTIMDFGCAKGYLVHALRLLGREAYGVDISEYAISQAPKEVSQYVEAIKPQSDNFDHCDLLLAKDILEHIPYAHLVDQMKVIRKRCNRIFAIIPLAKNNKYIIPAYELDKSHYIREDKEWWIGVFKRAGFVKFEATTDLGPFKANWQEVDSRGNLLIYGY